MDFVLIKHDLQGALFENGVGELIFSSKTATRKWRIGDWMWEYIEGRVLFYKTYIGISKQQRNW